MQKLDELLGGSVQLFGPEALQYVNVGEYLSRKSNALGVDPVNLIKSPEDMAAEQNQQAMQDTAQAVAPQVVSGIAAQAQQ